MRAASEELNVATSSISRQIAALEKDLGMRLIEGGRRKIKLTEAGDAAFAYYREMRAHEEVFLSRVEELRSVRTGTINLAVGEAFISDDVQRSAAGVHAPLSGRHRAREDERQQQRRRAGARRRSALRPDLRRAARPEGARAADAVAAAQSDRPSASTSWPAARASSSPTSASTASACRRTRSASGRSCARPSMPKASSSSRA